MFSVPSVGTFAGSVLRTLIDPNPLAVSLWKHISSLLQMVSYDYLVVVRGRAVVEYFGPRELVLDGQSVSRDTDPEYRPQNVNKEVDTQTW